MTTSHTSAPWQHINEDGQPIRGKDRKFPICYMDTGDEWNDADIALICAAPELLEALRGLLAQIQTMKGESSCIDEDIMQGREYRDACDIVAKASG